MATSAVRDTTAVRDPGSTEVRILDAALRVIGRHGVAGLNLGEVARDAGVGRATVYRAFPDGKQGVLEAAAAHEASRFFATVGPALHEAESLEDLIVAALSGAARFIVGSEALVYLAAFEPGIILTHVAFDRVDVVFDAAHAFLAPELARFLPATELRPVAEWLTRVALFYLCLPYAPIDLTDEAAARHLARSYLLPGLTSSVIPSPTAPIRS